MLSSHLAGNPVTLTIPLVDADGNAYTATAVSSEVVDGNENVIVAKAPVIEFTGVESELLITVGAEHNDLADTAPEVRTVRLYLTTESGVVLIEETYRLIPVSLLAVPKLSFQSYGSAMSYAADLINVDGWEGATRNQRIRALMTARMNIGLLRFDDEVGNINDFDATTFPTLSVEFREALNRAQVLEADFLLGAGTGSLQDKIDMGLTSDTVGESSQTFSGKGNKSRLSPVCPRAMAVLSRYLTSGIKIGRA